MKGDGEYNGRNVADVDISNESECQVLSATQQKPFPYWGDQI